MVASINNGEEVGIVKRGQPFAHPLAKRLVKIDFTAQLKKVWGNHVFSNDDMEALRDEMDERK